MTGIGDVGSGQDAAGSVTQRRAWLSGLAATLLFGLLSGWVLPAPAAVSEWDRTAHSAVRLLSSTDTVPGEDSVLLGLQFALDPGWKIYWRTPGDAGIPPQLDWTRSRNIESVDILWPAPKRFDVFGFENYGYENEVILPLRAQLVGPGPIDARFHVDYLACSDICVPFEADVALTLPAGTAVSSRSAGLIARFVDQVPGPEGGAGSGGLAFLDVNLSAAAHASPGDQGGARQANDLAGNNGAGKPGFTLHIAADAGQRPFATPDLFVEAPGNTWFGPPEIRFDADQRRARIAIPGGGAPAVSLVGTEVTLTLVDEGRSIERRMRIPTLLGAPLQEAGAATAGEVTLVGILLFALLGGLILNLMPCVLPVLSLKLLGVVGQGGASRRTVRIGFLAATAGILCSFLLLATALAGLRSAGTIIGWGIQFQNPVFLAAMTGVLVLFACNLFGWFEITLPSAISDRIGSEKGANSLAGHFLTGVLATLLATPCSAPFVGTAVGFALSRPGAEIFIVFLALGVGLALPYLAVAAVPRMVTWLPRPGPWMRWLRIVLGLALVATAVWLVDLIAIQLDIEAAIAVAALVALAGTIMGLRRMPDSRLGRHGGKVAVLLLAAACVSAFLHDPAPGSPPGSLPGYPSSTVAGGGSVSSGVLGASELRNALWRPLDRQEINKLVAAGKTVFVDVTADWCVTCLANKKLVLEGEAVSTWLAQEGVIAMRADWTRPDAEISAYLASYGRYGIPFNAIYGPSAPQGIVLPELLTDSTVLDTARRVRSIATAQGRQEAADR